MADPRKIKHLRVFYAHPSGHTLNKIEKDRSELQELLTKRFHKKIGAYMSPNIRVISGRREHQQSFSGDWEQWQKKVVAKKHSMTGDICYRMFVVPDEVCGRSTAAIIQHAKNAKRTVYLWEKDSGKLKPVRGIETFDAEDWTSGFRILTN
tara:strand:- start:512 stop:964 length:453 start_codon:yes stop_codon:yes gene_type:complete